ncbi:MAG TPA: hypothetical protein DIC19_01840 [Erysipelotrichaceae bacterium]|nr:hypothetical protein [Erysipelotrichaceae bacterium]
MMISPESYYEEYLSGRTKEQIMSAIRGLKQEIGRLKNSMENPNFSQVEVMHPSEYTRLDLTREYLKRAKQAYAEAGGTYALSKSEKRSADFNSNIDFICKINFSIGGFFGGYRKYTIELTDELKVHAKIWDLEEPLYLFDEEGEFITKENFIALLSTIHLEEWRRNYTTQRFGYEVFDGTQWELEVKYNNGRKPVRFSGSNAYPYNFERFKALLEIEDAIDAENA